MLGDFFIRIALWFVQSLIGFLPTSTGFPPEIASAFASIGGYADIFSPLIPWATMTIVVGLAFSVEIAIFGFKTLKWVISHLPFIGGKG